MLTIRKLRNIADSIGWICATIFLVVSISSLSPSFAQSANIKLNKSQINLLRSLGTTIAAPTYTPPKFRLQSVIAELSSNTRIGGINYKLIYRSNLAPDQTLCFAIESTNGGIGGIPTGENSYPTNSKSFGKSSIEFGKYGNNSEPTLLGEWLGNGPFYRFTGAGVIPELSLCENITPEEAVKVVESLQYL